MSLPEPDGSYPIYTYDQLVTAMTATDNPVARAKLRDLLVKARYWDEQSKTVQQVQLSQSVIRPETHLLPVMRIGDQARDACIDLVHERFAAGYLTEAEHGARVALMLKAQTKTELDRLVSDLPGKEEKKKAAPAGKDGFLVRKAPHLSALSMLLGGLAVCTGAAGIHNHPSLAAVLVPAICLVVAGIFMFTCGVAIGIFCERDVNR